jgi:hypothetical protein
MITDLRAKAAERASFRVDEEAELFIGRSCALGAGLHTTSTSDTPVSVVKYLGLSLLRFGIVTPNAPQGTTLQKDHSSDAWAITRSISFYVEHPSREVVFFGNWHNPFQKRCYRGIRKPPPKEGRPTYIATFSARTPSVG